MVSVQEFLATHCLFFWHDWVDSDKPVDITPPSERWYWTTEICSKCNSERAVLGKFYK